jgi:hypothetical protein
MAVKKGEGVRNVLSGLVSRPKPQPEENPEPVQPIALALPPEAETPAAAETSTPPEAQAAPTETPGPAETARPVELPPKAIAIKGRPRRRNSAVEAPPPGERVKVTLTIAESLRAQFYHLAWAEGIQPGEYMERAIRFYIAKHPK